MPANRINGGHTTYYLITGGNTEDMRRFAATIAKTMPQTGAHFSEKEQAIVVTGYRHASGLVKAFNKRFPGTLTMAKWE